MGTLRRFPVRIGDHDAEELRMRVGPGWEWVAVRLPGRSAGPATVVLSGGPGVDPVPLFTHAKIWPLTQALLASGDVILAGQRGVGRSAPDLMLEVPALPEGALETREGMYEIYRSQVQHVDSAEEMTPLQSAADLVAFLQAWGEPVRLLAHSYGTHLAMGALKQEAPSVERAVFLGFEGPDQTWKLPSLVQRRLGVLDRRTPFLAAMRRVLARADREPVFGVGGYPLRHVVGSGIGLSSTISRLPALFESIEAGDRTVLDQMVSFWVKGLRRSAVFYLNDGASGASPERLAQIRAEAGGCDLLDAFNFPFPEIAGEWGANDLGDEFRRPLLSDLPILIVTGAFDAFTPPENAQEGLAGLPSGVHQTVDAAHDELLWHPDSVTAATDFLVR